MTLERDLESLIYAISPVEPVPTDLERVAESLPVRGYGFNIYPVSGHNRSDPLPEKPGTTHYYRVDTEFGGKLPVFVRPFKVLRRTPKGVWVLNDCEERFVLDGAKKTLCYPTKALALQSFIARKRRQIQIVRAQLSNAENALAVALGRVPQPPKPTLFR